jgi:aminodeoxychorismate synthase component I
MPLREMHMLTPSLKAFLQAKKPVPLFKKRSLQHLDALKIYRHLAVQPPGCLLESVKGPSRVSRYSFIATEPFLVFEAKGHRITLTEGHRYTTTSGDPIKFLSELITRFYVPRPEGLPPFFGGAIGFFSYDLAHLFENLPHNAIDDLHLPDIALAFFETVAVIDHIEKSLYLIFCPTPEKFWQSGRDQLYQYAQETLQKIESKLLGPVPHPHSPPSLTAQQVPSPQANLSRDEYLERVKRCQDYIAQGDIFQANLSLRFSIPLQGCLPLTLYSILREVNPSPFAAFLNLGKHQLISSSPERLIHVSGRGVETRPIAGTRPRGKNPAEDRRMTLDLLTNVKERAEHLMLLDLERNDLGRVCQYGSIKVDEFMVTERYSHVMHIVSNIQGRLKENVTCLDVLQAVFPGGTITGVPKVRCMEIIDELEPVGRGPYTGSIGYISFAGDMDLNIIIRSLLTTEDTVYFQVGAGIVADSDPLKEYQECLYKAEALMKSVRMAQQLRQRNGRP